MSYLGKEEIAELGKQINADILIWGSVSAMSDSQFRVQAKILSMRSLDVIPISFDVTKVSKDRKASIKENLIAKLQEFSGGEVQKMFDIGLQQLSANQYSDAEVSFMKVIEIDPQNSEAFYYLGVINYKNENFEKSEEYYLKGLEIDPQNAKMLEFLSKTYLKMDDVEKAGETRKKIIAINDNKEEWYKLGFVYLEDEEYYGEAVEAFQKAIAHLGDNDGVDEHTIDAIEDCVCTLYGFPNIQKVDDVRIRMFEQKYAPRTDEDPLTSISGMHPSLMPPCYR